MKKIYVIGPLAGLLVFGGIYWQHAEKHAAQLAQVKLDEERAREEKRVQQDAARRLAMEQATAALAKRNAERAEKERIEEAQKLARAELETRRNTAFDRTRRLRPTIDRLRSEIETLNAAIARNEERKRELEQEQVFLADYVRQAEANRATIYAVLEKLESVEIRRIAPPNSPSQALRQES
jgi:hypothetical protein